MKTEADTCPQYSIVVLLGNDSSTRQVNDSYKNFSLLNFFDVFDHYFYELNEIS